MQQKLLLLHLQDNGCFGFAALQGKSTMSASVGQYNEVRSCPGNRLFFSQQLLGITQGSGTPCFLALAQSVAHGLGR